MKYEMIEKKSSDIVMGANNLVVSNQNEYIKAGKFVVGIKALLKEKIDATFKPMMDAAHKAHKEVCDQYKKYSVPVKNAISLSEGKMRTWKNEQERKAREEQARLEEKARKEAARLAARAEKAEDSGKTEKAEELREQAADREIFKPTVKAEVPKVAGVILRKNWSFRVKDFSKVPDKYKMMNNVKTGQVVRAMKEDTDIPGIEAYSE